MLTVALPHDLIEPALGVSLSSVPALGCRGQVQALGPSSGYPYCVQDEFLEATSDPEKGYASWKDSVMVHSCPGRRSGSSANLGKTCWHGIFPVHVERCLIIVPPSGMYMESVPFARHHCCCFWVSCETQGGWKLQWRKGLLTLALLQILQMNLILALNERILSARTAATKGKESCPPGGFSSSPGGEKASVSDSYPSFTTQFKWSLLPEVFLSFFPPGTYTLKLPSGPRRAPGGDDSAQASSQTLVRVFGGAAQDREKGAPGSGLPQECDPRANGPPAELYSSPPCWGSPGLRSSGLGLQPEEKSTENFR
ncbi:hypothetical protein MG293_014389 [Ovis ammon polii]|uniref:Uncharacterized protein n=1 Tax=Ovis ammon polii TaxID=230172 RepID=A0AAD4TWF7_OVIAM|nr:hypothetical protein MG293_014389 [Ovis ammon polii]